MQFPAKPFPLYEPETRNMNLPIMVALLAQSAQWPGYSCNTEQSWFYS